MKRYRVSFENAPFAWLEVTGTDPQDAELEAIIKVIRDFLVSVEDYGASTVEEVA